MSCVSGLDVALSTNIRNIPTNNTVLRPHQEPVIHILSSPLPPLPPLQLHIYRPGNTHRCLQTMADDRVEFDLKQALKYYLDGPTNVPCPDADSELLEAEGEPESLSNEQINRVLEGIIDSVAANPDAIAKSGNLDSLQCLLKYASPSSISYAAAIYQRLC